MAFSEDLLLTKLKHINTTQQAIQTISQWILFHKKRAKTIVDLWAKEIMHATPDRQLAFIYLANDILQNSRRTGPEFINEFARVLPSTFPQVFQNGEATSKKSYLRILDIWQERHVFPSALLSSIRRTATAKEGTQSSSSVSSSSALSFLPSSSSSSLDDRVKELLDSLATISSAAQAEGNVLSSLGGSPSDTALHSVAAQLRSTHTALEMEVKARTKVIGLLSELLEENEPALSSANARLATVQQLVARLDQLPAPAPPPGPASSAPTLQSPQKKFLMPPPTPVSAAPPPTTITLPQPPPVPAPATLPPALLGLQNMPQPALTELLSNPQMLQALLQVTAGGQLPQFPIIHPTPQQMQQSPPPQYSSSSSRVASSADEEYDFRGPLRDHDNGIVEDS